jgi:PEGA domain
MLRRGTLAFGALCLMLGACAPASALRKTVPYLVRSNPPGALLHIDGESAGTTPATITFFVSRWWVGLWNSRDGWRYGDEAYTVTAVL